MPAPPTLPLRELVKLAKLPQYRQSPIVYYISQSGTPTLDPGPGVRIYAYVLCHNDRCIGIHDVMGDIIIDGTQEDVLEVIDAYTRNPRLAKTRHERLALSRLFDVPEDFVEELVFSDSIEEKIKDKLVVLVKGIVFILSKDHNVIIERLDIPHGMEKIVYEKAFVSRAPIRDLARHIRDMLNPILVIPGIHTAAFCRGDGECKCLPVGEIAHLIAGELGLPLVKPAKGRVVRGGLVVEYRGRLYRVLCKLAWGSSSDEEEVRDLDKIAFYA